MKFSEVFGGASWVTSDAAHQCPYIRQVIELDDEPELAIINICGLGFFELYINGAKVSGDIFTPAHSDYCERRFTLNSGEFNEKLRHRVYYMQYEVSAYLTRGKNAVCVMLAPGWFSQSIPVECGDLRYGDVRLAYHMKVECAGGAEYSFVSGPQLKWAAGPITGYDLFKGEEYDLSLSRDGWLLTDYDDSEFKPCAVLPDLDTDYQLQDCPADAVIRHIKPVRLPSGVYDLGENISGTPVLRALGNRGDVVEVRFSEELTPDGTLDPDYMFGQHARFALDGEQRLLRSRFTWYGFRYFEVSGPAEVVDALVMHTDIAVTSSFDSDNTALNWLYEAYVRTQLCNIHAAIPSDCPHIERRGYTGDGQLTCLAAMTTLDARDFYNKWLRDIEDCQDDITGHVQYTAPYTQCGGGPGGWGCAIVHVPYAYWLHYGDTEPARRMLPRMLKYFDYLDAHSAADLVVSDNPGQWCLGDWCTPDEIKIPEPFVNNYFYIKSIDEVLKLAEALNIAEYNDRLMIKRRALCDAVMREYYDAATGDFAGNIQGANAFAVDIGLGDQRTFDNMLANYKRLGQYDTGIFGTDIVTRVLFERGEAQTAFELLSSQKEVSYDGMRRRGATTLWEYWALDRDRSHSHPMFGAPVEYLFKYLLGIGQSGAGYERIVIEPRLVDGLNYISGGVDTPHGHVNVRINRVDAHYTVDIHTDSPERTYFRLNGQDMPLDDRDTQLVLG